MPQSRPSERKHHYKQGKRFNTVIVGFGGENVGEDGKTASSQYTGMTDFPQNDIGMKFHLVKFKGNVCLVSESTRSWQSEDRIRTLGVLEEEQLLTTKPEMWAWTLETEVEMRKRMFKLLNEQKNLSPDATEKSVSSLVKIYA
ncbi:hypothetical protein MJT46_011009 [Ovis ammon polii x Ovis aries]|nr:hypothetical protein MJT46_011009 [Ovis ammon polii x Ovis aries]